MITRRTSISGAEMRQFRRTGGVRPGGIRPGTIVLGGLADPDNAAYEELPCPPDPRTNYMTDPFVRSIRELHVANVAADDAAADVETIYKPYGSDVQMKDAVGCASCHRGVGGARLGAAAGPWGLGWGTFFGVLGAAVAGGAMFELFRQR